MPPQPGPMRPAVTACSRYSAIRLMPRHCGPRAWAVPTNSMPAPRTALRTQRRPFGPGSLAAHHRKLATFAQVRDAEICVALRAQRIGTAGDARFRLDFFAIEDIAARVLLDKHPLAPGGTPPVQVVIIGSAGWAAPYSVRSHGG